MARTTKLSRSKGTVRRVRLVRASQVRLSAPSLPSPTDPILRANPFPEVTDLFCRLPLPTLFYGPEAAHLGDLLRLWVRTDAKIILSPKFSRAFGNAPDSTRSVELYQPFDHISWQTDSMVGRLLTRKENSSRGHRRRPWVRLRYRRWCAASRTPISAFRFGNINPIPFRLMGHECPFLTEFPCGLGSTNPCPTAVHMEPFSTSVFKVLIWIFATTTKIFTRDRFTQAHAKGCVTIPTPSYSSACLHWRPGIGTTLERHPFSGLVDSAGGLLHTP